MRDFTEGMYMQITQYYANLYTWNLNRRVGPEPINKLGNMYFHCLANTEFYEYQSCMPNGNTKSW